ELGRHRANRRARLVALALPRRRAEAVQSRRWSLAVTDRAVGLELIDPVERDVEPVPTLVLDDGDLEHRAIRADGDGLEAAVDADPVLQMADIAARCQRPGGGGRARAAIARGPPQAPGPPEDLVVGENTERRHDEAAVERPDGERRAIGPQ